MHPDTIVLTQEEFVELGIGMGEVTENAIAQLFDAWSVGQVNMYEVIIAIIVYGKAAMNDKIKFMFQIFDNQGKGFFTYEELSAAVKVVLGAISRMTEGPNYPQKYIEKITETALMKQQKITLEKLQDYICRSELSKLMQQYLPTKKQAQRPSVEFNHTATGSSVHQLFSQRTSTPLQGKRQPTIVRATTAATPRRGRAQSTKAASRAQTAYGTGRQASQTYKNKSVTGIIIGGDLYTKKTVSTLKASFDCLDQYNTGKINIRDYLSLGPKSTLKRALKSNLENMIAAAGIRREAQINFMEFLKFMLPLASQRQLDTIVQWVSNDSSIANTIMNKAQRVARPLKRDEVESLIHLFRIFDKDRDGKLTHSEFTTAFSSIPLKEREATFSDHDKGGKGFLTLTEFLAAMIPAGWCISRADKNDLNIV